MENRIRRGDIFYANLQGGIGSEQTGERPVVIIQNDIGNLVSPTVIVAVITSSSSKAKLPTHVFLSKKVSNLKRDSIILAEQIRTIDKKRLEDKIAHLNNNSKEMKQLDAALEISIHLKRSER